MTGTGLDECGVAVVGSGYNSHAACPQGGHVLVGEIFIKTTNTCVISGVYGSAGREEGWEAT